MNTIIYKYIFYSAFNIFNINSDIDVSMLYDFINAVIDYYNNNIIIYDFIQSTMMIMYCIKKKFNIDTFINICDIYYYNDLYNNLFIFMKKSYVNYILHEHINFDTILFEYYNDYDNYLYELIKKIYATDRVCIFKLLEEHLKHYNDDELLEYMYDGVLSATLENQQKIYNYVKSISY